MSWRQYRALVVTFLRIAWRGPVATDGAKVRRGAVAKGFLSYVVIGAIFAIPSLIVSEPRGAGLLLQSVSFMMVALAFLNIYGDLVFDARDVPLLFWRPLDHRAYLAARLTAIVVYFAGVTAALNLPGALVLGLRFGPVWYPLAHYLGALVGAFAALVIALVVLFLLIKTIGRERLRDTIAWVQIAATLFFVGGNQLLQRSRLMRDLPEEALLAGAPAFLLPMCWAQAVADVLSLRPFAGESSVAAVGVAVPLGAGAILVLLFGRAYGDILRAFGEVESKHEVAQGRGLVRRAFERATGPDPTARAGFLLAWATIRRARDYKVRALPSFGMPVIFFTMAMLHRESWLLASVPPMLALSACIGLISLLGSEHAAAGWAWQLAPDATPADAARGAAMAVAGALAMPVVLLLGAVVLVTLGPLQALGFVSLSAALSLATLRCVKVMTDSFPCTLTLEEARRGSKGLQTLAVLAAAGILTAVDALLRVKVGAWVSPLFSAPILLWGWLGIASRR